MTVSGFLMTFFFSTFGLVTAPPPAGGGGGGGGGLNSITLRVFFLSSSCGRDEMYSASATMTTCAANDTMAPLPICRRGTLCARTESNIVLFELLRFEVERETAPSLCHLCS